MNVQAISHIAIGVTEMERALGFYRDVVGLRVRADQVEELPQMGGEEPHKRRAVYLCYGEGPHESFVVLDQMLSVDPYGEPARLFQTGVHHFAFWVDDLDELVERIRGAGIDVTFGPMDAATETYGEPPGGIVRTAIVNDPDGNLVQFDQRA